MAGISTTKKGNPAGGSIPKQKGACVAFGFERTLMYSPAPMRRVRSRRGNSFSSERIKQFRSGAVARGFLLLATGLLCSVSGVTENREESRSIIYSDWQERTAAEVVGGGRGPGREFSGGQAGEREVYRRAV